MHVEYITFSCSIIILILIYYLALEWYVNFMCLTNTDWDTGIFLIGWLSSDIQIIITSLLDDVVYANLRMVRNKFHRVNFTTNSNRHIRVLVCVKMTNMFTYGPVILSGCLTIGWEPMDHFTNSDKDSLYKAVAKNTILCTPRDPNQGCSAMCRFQGHQPRYESLYKALPMQTK